MINFFSRKTNPVGQAVFVSMNKTDPHVKDYFKNGYAINPIIYRCIDETAKACASVDIYPVKTTGEVQDEYTDESLARLLERPNPTQSWAQFIAAMITEHRIYGECFAIAAPLQNEMLKSKPTEIWVVPASLVKVVGGKAGMVEYYEIKNVQYPVDQLTGACAIFHHKTYNPQNAYRGLSPLMAAAVAGDTHNAALQWNNSLLQNSARPSGILKFPLDQEPSVDAIDRLKRFFKQQIQGSGNAGEVPLLTGGVEWQAVDHSPRDMDYLASVKHMEKLIASVFGVPLPLIDNDAASYNNMEQASERFWTTTVLPLLKGFLDDFGDWLLPVFGEDLKLCYDADSIPALEGIQTKRYDKLGRAIASGLVTVNDALKELGYETIGDAGDQRFISAGLIPLDVAADTTSDAVTMDALAKAGYTDQELFEATGRKK